jgi:hypothetical protein
MDQNHFINTYIDVSINSLLEYVKTNLQLQTQIKVSESVIGLKDQMIADLTRQLAENKTAEDWKTKYEAAEANYSAAMSKLNHMNVLMGQIADMKQQILTRDAKIAILEQELESTKDTKKVINTKVKKKDATQSEKTLDDF